VRPPPPALALLTAVLCLSACGASTQGTSTEGGTTPGHFEGGEKSIEGFGTEASGETRAELLVAFHGYLGALAARDYAKACGYLGAAVKRSLERFTKPGSGLAGCAETLPGVLSPSAPTLSREQNEGEVKKVRVEGDRAFVVYHAPGAALYQLTMGRESGAWKAEYLGGSVLVPSAATLGE
jgi:hypothetical protein